MVPHRTVGGDVFQELDVYIICLLFSKRGHQCMKLYRLDVFLLVEDRNAEWDIIYQVRPFQLVYNVHVANR